MRNFLLFYSFFDTDSLTFSSSWFVSQCQNPKEKYLRPIFASSWADLTQLCSEMCYLVFQNLPIIEVNQTYKWGLNIFHES